MVSKRVMFLLAKLCFCIVSIIIVTHPDSISLTREAAKIACPCGCVFRGGHCLCGPPCVKP